MDTSRRVFLATGGIVATGTLLGLNPVFGRQNQNLIKVGVIGTGVRGQQLANYIRRIPELQVAACCDVIPFRLEEGLAKASPNAASYTDYRKLLEDKNVDAVVIATPFSMHAQMALDAIDAGKHIYCEKTMTHGVEETRRVVKKAQQAKTVFQTGHQYHFSRLYTHVVDMLKEGKIGEIAGFECQWNRNTTWRRHVPDPKWERLINWRMYREYSGGLTAELSSHQIDFVNWVLEAEPAKVAGFGGIDYYKDGRETFDNKHLIYEYPNGVTAKFTCLTTNKYNNYLIRILGKDGTIELQMDRATYYPEEHVVRQTESVDAVTRATRSIREGEPIEVEHRDPTEQALVDFHQAIVSGRKPLSDVVTGANTSFCVQMALDSLLNEKIEYWKDTYNL